MYKDKFLNMQKPKRERNFVELCEKLLIPLSDVVVLILIILVAFHVVAVDE